MTRRKLRRLNTEARRWWRNGQNWEAGSQVAAPAAGPFRIAFDAGREAERARKAGESTADWSLFGSDLPIDVWVRVVAEWMRTWP